MAVKTYSGADVLLSVGDRRLTGFADGDFVEITPRSPTHEDYSGTDGEVTIALTNDRRFDVNITLAQSSSSNDVLSELYNLGGTHRLVVRDLRGTSLFEGTGWFRQLPGQTFGRSVGSRQWQLSAESKTVTIGGNS
jgi:hypothetical protein